MSTHRYRWTGEISRSVGREISPGVPARGEITGTAIDQSLYTNGIFGRAGLGWTFLPGHVARVSFSPQGIFRIGDDHVPDRVDLLRLHESIQQIVAGVEYELNAFEERLSNIAFGKLYYQDVYFEGLTSRNSQQVKYKLARDSTYFGGGDALRYRFADWLTTKLSYEYATRLPRPEELFGEGVMVLSNTSLRPERSHNVNLGSRLDLRKTKAGDFMVDVNGFLRNVKDQIVMFANVQGAPYENVLDVRSLGVEGAASWDSPGRYVGLDFSCTYQDIRNASTSGVFEATNGRRMPNRPWLFGNAGARGRVRELLISEDALEPFFVSRYVHGYDRGWALANVDVTRTMRSQLSHSAGFTYSVTRPSGTVFATFEVDNLSNAGLFDNYGVQRPGRSFNFKLSGQL
jgi:vitamin B12 transporter